MKRFDIIDGMRGYFLVFMVLNHLIFAGGFSGEDQPQSARLR
jgi:hypothetical protein